VGSSQKQGWPPVLSCWVIHKTSQLSLAPSPPPSLPPSLLRYLEDGIDFRLAKCSVLLVEDTPTFSFSQKGREGGTEGGREGGRDGGREGGREGGGEGPTWKMA